MRLLFFLWRSCTLDLRTYTLLVYFFKNIPCLRNIEIKCTVRIQTLFDCQNTTYGYRKKYSKRWLNLTTSLQWSYSIILFKFSLTPTFYWEEQLNIHNIHLDTDVVGGQSVRFQACQKPHLQFPQNKVNVMNYSSKHVYRENV